MRLILSIFIFILLGVLTEGYYSPKVSPANILYQNHVNQKQFPKRNFTADYTNNVFSKDGKPFQFVAGEFDYFRAHPSIWRQVLRTMRAGGINVVSTYVEWALHNPNEGQYVWTGMADVVKFIEIAAEEDLLVMFRMGPYINGERSGVSSIHHFHLNYVLNFGTK